MIWIETASGRSVSLTEPTPESICPRDISHHLALINRFCGATHTPFSVAQHSLLVLEIVEQALPNLNLADDRLNNVVRLYALLHDAHEAYKGDDSTPKKWVVSAISADKRNPLRMLETALDKAIFVRFGLIWPVPQSWARVIKAADMVALATERRDLLRSRIEWDCLKGVTPWPNPIKPMTWDRAEEAFFARLSKLIDLSHEIRFQATAIINPKTA